MYGAIALAGRAALRSGAGLVTVATPSPCVEVVAGLEPCYMTLALPTDGEGRIVAAARDRLQAQPADAVACGPGLSQDRGVGPLVQWMYQTLPQPLVVDADGLNALAREGVDLRSAAGPRLLTPHPGEFRRLVGKPLSSISDLRRLAPAWAAQQRLVLVLKGHRTLITDGKDQCENTTGNPGMATGGTGDVLTGILVGLLGQGLDVLSAARLGVYLHGLAGDLAAAKLGQISLIARDLIDYLPAAFRQHHEGTA
jgi:NAD(P)H-hydrate epimerase